MLLLQFISNSPHKNLIFIIGILETGGPLQHLQQQDLDYVDAIINLLIVLLLVKNMNYPLLLGTNHIPEN